MLQLPFFLRKWQFNTVALFFFIELWKHSEFRWNQVDCYKVHAESFNWRQEAINILYSWIWKFSAKVKDASMWLWWSRIKWWSITHLKRTYITTWSNSLDTCNASISPSSLSTSLKYISAFIPCLTWTSLFVSLRTLFLSNGIMKWKK